MSSSLRGGILQPDNNKPWDPGEEHECCQQCQKSVVPNRCFAVVAAASLDNDEEMQDMDGEHRTELDSHANMPVVGRHSYIINKSGKKVDVSPFTPQYKSMQAELVDAIVRYDCPYAGKPYLLVIQNALWVEAMENNLVPPFILRESGIKVNERAKIHTDDPTVDDHAITFPATGFRIPLSLWGVFSYFPSVRPTEDDLVAGHDVYVLTPSRWNPHSDAYEANEASMLDWEGNIKERKDQLRIVVDDIPDPENGEDYRVSSAEAHVIDRTCAACHHWQNYMAENRKSSSIEAHDEVGRHLSSVSSVLVESMMALQLEDRMVQGKEFVSIGATVATEEDEENDDGSSVEDEEHGDAMDLDLDALDDVDLDDFFVSSVNAGKPNGIGAEHLAKVWRISHDDAKRTLAVTSQRSKRPEDPTLSQNYGTNDRMLRYRRIEEYFYMDTFFATKKGGKSSRGNTCCQLFVTDKGFMHVVPMKRKSEVLMAVKIFAKEIGAPDALICDMSKEQTSSDMKIFLNEIGTTLRALEEGTPWANKAELYIKLMKEAVRKDMREANSPLPFWDYCLERRVRIDNLTARDYITVRGTNPYTATLGIEGDISSLGQYKWYEWCYFREHTAKFPHNQEVLGRILGPAKGEGNEMAQWVLKANGNVVPRRSTRPLQESEIHSASEQSKRSAFNALIERRHGTSIQPPPPISNDDEKFYDPYEDDEQPQYTKPDIEDTVDNVGRLLNQCPAYDRMINAEVQMQIGDEMSKGVVKRRALGADGKTSGKYHDDPYSNSILYEVEFTDGQVKEYAANIIAESMLAEVDTDGNHLRLMEGIVEWKKDESLAVPKRDKYVYDRHGRRRARKTTRGWWLLVKWKDGSESWQRLADMKESYPIETAEFAVARGLDDEPAFQWWAKSTLRRRDAIISALKTRARQIKHKYGIEIPTSVEHAKELDKKNGNDYWMKALAKEMFNVGVAFEILAEGEKAPYGWHLVTGHLVWDVKMDFTRKARWVLDGHKTPDPEGSTFAGVVSRESVRIAFTYAALNGLDVFAADIRNAYLQAPSSRKDYIICGPEFGIENVGKIALVHRALYGGKTAGKDFRNHLRSCMSHLGFKSCPADPDVWMRPAEKSDGTTYYEYVLLYVDDALAIGENAEKILREEIGRYFELKEESVGPPSLYLGGRVRKVVLENGAEAWAFSSSQYVQAAVKNVEDYLAKDENKRWSLPSKADTPMKSNYRAELDVSAELSPGDASYYQSLIGVLRWIVELGRVDICLEVSILSSHLALPREGHMQQVLQVFSYLRKYHNAELVYDPSDPVINVADFERRDWTASEFGHIDGKEELPPNMPEPRGMGFTIRAKVDADHASDTVSRRSRTGFLVYLNSALTYWWSKKQTSIESSSFGSEFIAMKQCCEYLRGLRYKLRMMGIPCDGPSLIYGDNQSVLANTTIPDSALKKKSQSIAYHFVREGVARDEWRTTYINTHANEADLLTKVLPNGEKRRGFVRNLLHHIFGTE